MLRLVRDCVTSAGIDILDIAHHQYQEAYHFTRGIESARIDICYNIQQKIVSVSQTNNDELDNDLLSLLAPLNGRIVSNGIADEGQSWEFDEPFLNELHQKLTQRSSDSDIVITNVKELQNSQRYWFQKQTDTAVMDIYYNKKQQITNCTPLNNLSSSKSLMNEALAMITGGLD